MSDDLSQLIVDLERGGDRAKLDALGITRHEAQDMRADWRRRVTGVRGLPYLPMAVSSDVLPVGVWSWTAEVGYDKRGQGELGNIVEFGSSRQGPIRPVGDAVLQAAAGRLERYLGDLGDGLL